MAPRAWQVTLGASEMASWGAETAFWPEEAISGPERAVFGGASRDASKHLNIRLRSEGRRVRSLKPIDFQQTDAHAAVGAAEGCGVGAGD